VRDLARAAAFLLALSWRTDRRRLLGAAALMLAGYAGKTTAGVAPAGLPEPALARHPAAGWAAAAAAALLVFELMMAHFAHLAYFELGELAELELNSELIELAGRRADLRQLESPQFADGLALIRADLVRTREALAALLQLAGVLAQTVITTAILAAVNPLLTVLLLAALPPVLAGRRAHALIDAAREGTAEQVRLVNHLLRLATTAGPVAELSVSQAGAEVAALTSRAWVQLTVAEQAAHRRAAVVRGAGQLVFAAAYAGAIVLVAWQALGGQARVGDVILIITLAVQVNAQVSGALGLLAVLQGAGRTARRLGTLRAAAVPEHPAAPGDATGSEPAPDRAGAGPAPGRLRQGIRLDHVSFAYPGRAEPALRDVTLDLPAGSVVAIVGENGAGKSTLAKLLCGLYQPTAGRIEADGTDLRALGPGAWRAGLAVLFQDFARIELTLRESVGTGDLPRLGDEPAVRAALHRAAAGRIAATVPGGLAGLLGRGYGDGAELSGGQWQSVGLARGLMRPAPVLLILDEPAAALDAAAESAIVASYRESARQAGRAAGAVTVVVSHRLATVRLADLIVMLDHGEVAERGRHADLMAAGGQYAEVFELHARGYR
jgi:ATP-binding cassette, subfamily B, bacterial